MTHFVTTQRRRTILRAALLATLVAPLAACGSETMGVNRGMQSVHQPVVSYTSFTYDVGAGGGDLSPSESARLEGWLSSIGIGYGDRVAIASNAGYYSPGVRDGIANVIARHGLLIEEDESGQAGSAPDGAVRLIVRRASASVPGCPDWSEKAESNGTGGTSSNFGCGVNGNLAAMVANPEDLVRGQTTDSDLRTATSNRAIQTYRDKALTGAGDLKEITAGGSN